MLKSLIEGPLFDKNYKKNNSNSIAHLYRVAFLPICETIPTLMPGTIGKIEPPIHQTGDIEWQIKQ